LLFISLMLSTLEDRYIRTKIKIIHWFGIGVFLVFFGLLFFLQSAFQIDTLLAQYILLVMAGVLAFSYLALLFSKDGAPKISLFIFYTLAILTTILVWSTGMFQSPFIILYVILIIIISQLYGYKYALALVVLAVWGLVFMYGLSASGLLQEYSLLYYKDTSLLYQPSLVVMMYAVLYSLLFIFTVFSSSSAHVLLFRQTQNSELSSTMHEKIVQEVPIGVLIVDNNFVILGGNPAAKIDFSFSKPATLLTTNLKISKKQLKKDFKVLSTKCDRREFVWSMSTGGTKVINLSVRILAGKNEEDLIYILFLEDTEENKR